MPKNLFKKGHKVRRKGYQPPADDLDVDALIAQGKARDDRKRTKGPKADKRDGGGNVPMSKARAAGYKAMSKAQRARRLAERKAKRVEFPDVMAVDLAELAGATTPPPQPAEPAAESE